MHTSPQKGFTLIETLVAITILIVMVTGAFTAAQTGLSGSIYSRDQITSFYLAQEGIEEIRNIRDENGLSGRNWLAGIASQASDPCYFGKACVVDAVANTVVACAGGSHSSCPVVKTDPVNGFYGYNSSWVDTPFTRSIVLMQINADEVQIISTVTWSKGPISRTFRVRENILNWQ